jgi:hypothetical protein
MKDIFCLKQEEKMKIKTFALALTLVLGFTSSAHALNYALFFDGINDVVQVQDSNSLKLSSGMTIEAMVKLESPGRRFIVHRTNGSDGIYLLKIYDYTLRPEGFVMTTGGHGYAETNNTILLNEWAHLATTYNGSDINIFINGMRVGYGGISGDILDSSGILNIGNVYGTYPFHGTIDEVRIWNYGRTEQQIRDYMNCELFGDEAGLVGYWNFNEGSGQIAHDLTQYGNNGQLGYTMEIDTNDPRWVLSDSPVGPPIPEPSTLLLLGIGLLPIIRRKR